MSAFVPGAGLPLSSSRVFVSGANVNDTSLAPLRTPKTGTASVSMSAASRLTNMLKVGSKTVEAAPPKPAQSESNADSALSDGLPKFYNPVTARAEFRATAKGQNSTPYDLRIGNYQKPGNRRVNEQDTFRNMDPYTDDLVWARPGWSSDEARVGVRTALRNVTGNAHLFDSEIAELSYSISCVTKTANMKEFVRAIGLSSAYRSRFFDSTSNTRFVECNFKHFLGRAPQSQEEVSEHIRIINEEGYNAEINSYVDSDEYDTLWGDSRIPAVNFQGGYPYNNDMNKLAVLSGGFSSSDSVSTKACFQTGDSAGFSGYAVKKGLPEAWRGENVARDMAGPVSEFDPDIFWNPQPPGIRAQELAWTARFGNWSKFWYKDSAIFQEVMKPKTSSTVEEVEEAEAILKYGSNMAKNYLGCRWAYDVAPVIEIREPSSPESMNGQLSVKMTEITFPIPASLQQSV